jgi:hypothetical protein
MARPSMAAHTAEESSSRSFRNRRARRTLRQRNLMTNITHHVNSGNAFSSGKVPSSLILPGLLAFLIGLAPYAKAQTFTLLYQFRSGPNGINPYAGVVRDAMGNLYGTTYNDGILPLGQSSESMQRARRKSFTASARRIATARSPGTALWQETHPVTSMAPRPPAASKDNSVAAPFSN